MVAAVLFSSTAARCAAGDESDPEDAKLICRTDERGPVVVRDMFEAKGYREWEEEDGEANWHVYWKAGRFKPSEYAAASVHQRVNHFPKTTGLTKKDCLLRNLRRMRAIHGQVYSFFPESYILPTEYLTLVRNVEASEHKPIWILKPTDSSQGRKIFLIRDLSEISYDHFSNAMNSEFSDDRKAEGQPISERGEQKLDEKGRAIATELDISTTLKMLKSRLNRTVTPCVKFTEMHIAQRYIDRPLCVCGYKLDLRLYVLIASAQPLHVYLYHDCLLRFATQKYDLSDLDNTYSHLTNSSINRNSTSYALDKEGIRAGCKWSLIHFLKEYHGHALGSPLLWARIKAIINLSLLSIAPSIPDNGGCFELLGYDVIVDEALKPWLLEVNSSPALGVDCAADEQVKQPLIGDLANLLITQREASARSACPVGGGAAAAKARSGGAAKGAGAGAPASERSLPKGGGRAAPAPAAELLQEVGGYKLIFPFNTATETIARGGVGGKEAQIVQEVRGELLAAAASEGDERGEALMQSLNRHGSGRMREAADAASRGGGGSRGGGSRGSSSGGGGGSRADAAVRDRREHTRALTTQSRRALPRSVPSVRLSDSMPSRYTSTAARLVSRRF